MKRFVVFIIGTSFLVQLSVANVWITEVQPFKISDEEEWFEFLIEDGEPINIENWKVSNGKTQKTIGAVRNQLIYEESGIFTGSGSVQTDLVFTSNQKHYLSWIKSPISLKNSGGIVQILNEKDEIVSELAYPKGKYGTRKDYKYSEVFNWDFVKNRIYPLIFRNNFGNNFTHTKGTLNQKSPVFSEDVVILVSEISMDRDKEKGGDFIEFYFESGPSKINLKYGEIKYNGTTLYFFEDDFWVLPDQFLTLWVGKDFSGIIKNTAPYEIFSDKKEGLSTGSGTIELILMSDTSFETTEDFVCYMDENLSTTEQNRVTKNIKNWTDDCIDISEFIPNQSIARSRGRDANNVSDFFNHFNGTPGKENVIENKTPTAVITVQGSGKTQNTAPFSINLTGENTIDPDGKKDIKTFIWKLDGVIFSEEENPKSFKLENLGEYEVSLEITDFSGETDNVSQVFSVISTGSVATGSQSKGGKDFIEKILSPKIKKGEEQVDDFFSDFIANVPDSFWEEVQAPPRPVSSFDPRDDEIVEVIENLVQKKLEKREKWIAKNIGWVFVEEV